MVDFHGIAYDRGTGNEGKLTASESLRCLSVRQTSMFRLKLSLKLGCKVSNREVMERKN